MAMNARSALSAVAIAAVLCVAAIFAHQAGIGANPNPDKLVEASVTIIAKPVTSFHRATPEQKAFGRLTFLGGLELSSRRQRHFGGWSGLVLDADGKNFIAISDRGAWLTATLDYSDGTLSGVSNARIGPLLARDGVPLGRARYRDAESIALLSGTAHDGKALIGFEQFNRLARYDVLRAKFSPELEVLSVPRGAFDMRRNNGFEAMTVMRGGPFKGSPIAISERLYDAWRNHTGWIWTDGGDLLFHLSNIDDFEITDIASLDDGTLFVLERRFRWLEGVRMRIRRVDAVDLQPGKTIEGETIITADANSEIDNMEGIDATRRDDGTVILTLISDNNFNARLQRTLLLQFAVSDAHAANTRL